MLGSGLLASVLLASAAAAQMNQLKAAWTVNPLSAMFDFDPKTFPSDPSLGWNFTTTVQKDGVSAYVPPLFDREPRAYTEHPGAKVTTSFYGYGAVVRGRVFRNSTLTLTVAGDGRLANTTAIQQGSMEERKLIEVIADDRVNKWRTMTLTVDNGAFQLRNVSFLQTVPMAFQIAQDSPVRGLNATQFNSHEIDKYYHTTGTWKTEDLLDPTCQFRRQSSANQADAAVESPHVIGGPGASIAFRTWPGAASLVMRGLHGREAGEIKYKIVPPPHDAYPAEVTANLSRPIEGVYYFAQVVLDPSVRYNVTITNSDPQRKFKFSNALHYLSSE